MKAEGSVEEVRARFEAFVSTLSWMKATIGLGRSGDDYADPCVNSRWQGWKAAYAERIEADESAGPVAWMMEWPNSAPSLTTVKSDYVLHDQSLLIPLFTHPPAQAAQVDLLRDARDSLSRIISKSIDTDAEEINALSRLGTALSAVEERDHLRSALAAQPRTVPDVQAMVDHFLGWRLPDDFAPDAGIGFAKPTNPAWWPTGTNLLTAAQAEQMFRYVLAAAPHPGESE